MALIYIGIVTALIQDLAMLFGCAVGLEDSITAITVVALGTSLPDTFASKVIGFLMLLIDQTDLMAVLVFSL